jgi:hypothetical protein
MKIEMGESLFYSWLRHIKECQLVQTNWKTSPNWTFYNKGAVDIMFSELNCYFQDKFDGNVFKKTASLDQLLQQGECDVLGISANGGALKYYAVDVAFHEAGLNYGSKAETVLKVIAKCVRTAFCLIGCFDTKEGQVIFASPKVNPSLKTMLVECITSLNQYFDQKGYAFEFSLICNEDFDNLILQPTLIVSKDVADTSELFMRAYQLIDIFATKQKQEKKQKVMSVPINTASTSPSVYAQMKIGVVARVALREILENGNISQQELDDLQTIEYSKTTFGLAFPLLVNENSAHDRIRYYSNPIVIKSKKYLLCSQWYEDKRQLLLKWMDLHKI